VADNEQIFGDTIQLARYLCFITKPIRMAIASSVKELVTKDQLHKQANVLSLSAQDEAVLKSLFAVLESNWQDPDFDVDDFCKAMAMSKSQLYRKTVALTGLAPNILMKDFRLEKAKDLMHGQHYNIAQVTFDSGFTSPSYFTKCFKKKYGILPGSYLESLS
jgi:AraC-like DNA-binding protein